eukprot:3167084-Amphidinium_carterae.2
MHLQQHACDPHVLHHGIVGALTGAVKDSNSHCHILYLTFSVIQCPFHHGIITTKGNLNVYFLPLSLGGSTPALPIYAIE